MEEEEGQREKVMEEEEEEEEEEEKEKEKEEPTVKRRLLLDDGQPIGYVFQHAGAHHVALRRRPLRRSARVTCGRWGMRGRRNEPLTTRIAAAMKNK